jgi:DNA-binding transcriptional ArsR family regulator
MEASAVIDTTPQPNGYGSVSGRWRLFCSHGTLLFYVVRHPGCTIQEIADALALSPRTVWGLIGDLKRAKLITVRREGRRHYYTVVMEGRFPDPILAHLTLGEAMRAIECTTRVHAETTR